ncbi:hypothetical protein Barb4_00508 [Bacteroidales bacterium Barb4]|nr:hypothetical protein Barb4_00508 [Bacteroidales bacterium Barb4]
MEKCFVIQPFDNSRFDKRFADVFKPAIEKANLEAYRVDKDLSVRIPIEDIEKGIMTSSICFAEITTDNPNVWYELGFAFACRKDVVMVCSDERKEKYPFDIQHKKVINYSANSKSDFEKLEESITKTIKSYQETSTTIQKLSTLPVQNTEGLSGHEIAMLILLMEDSVSKDDYTPIYNLRNKMGYAGYTNVATSIAARTLKNYGMIEIFQSEDWNGEPFQSCRLTEKGENWLLSNQDKLQFRKSQTDVQEINNLLF